MKIKRKHNSNEENFWLSATDMMAGILTVVLLLLMLFVLYLNQSKDEVFTPLDATQHVGDVTNPIEQLSPTGDRDDVYSPTTHAGAGASEAPTQPPTEPPTEPPRPGSQEDGTDKAAVFVTVVDADTGNTIKKSGTEFELYAEKNGIGGLQTLHTYYPNKIEYKKYETNDQGTFYLPEKITDGWYSLHNTVAPQGYYAENFTDFQIGDFYDWHEPFMVTVKLKPIKSTIRIEVTDPDSKKPVQNAQYEVVATNDIRSADGTVRYKAGKVVDKLKTDKDGCAESIELILGEYHLRQTSAPECYSVSNVPVEAVVGEPSNSEEEGVIHIDCSKTAVNVTITDKRTSAPVQGVVYTMDGRKGELETDAQGKLTISDLKKNSSYTLRLKSLPDGYKANSKQMSFIVDGDGLIDGEPSASIEDTVYTLTLSVSAKEKLFSRSVAAVDMELLDKSGKAVDSWTSNQDPHIVTGLTEGTYYLQKLGDKNSRVTVEIKDTADVQNAALYLWDVFDLFILLMAVGVIILAVLIAGLVISRKKKVKMNNERN